MNEIEKAIKSFKKRNKGLKNNPVCQDIQERVDKQNYEIVRNNIAIEALEKQLNSGWISVIEMLPNYTSDYNVTVGVGSELGYFEEVRTYRYEIYNGKNPYRKWIVPNRFDEVINIIAWRQLPETYKEDI